MARIDEVLVGEKSWGQYGVDFAGHVLLGFVYSAVGAGIAFLLNWGTGVAWLCGAGVALTGGVIREIVQWEAADYAMAKLHPLDRTLDALQHLVGTPLGVWLAWGVVT